MPYRRGGGNRGRGRGRGRCAQPEVEHELRTPRGIEVVGRVVKSQGSSRFMVLCSDGNERLCSIPKKFKRAFWIKENDVVLVEPWTLQSDIRGDIIMRYSISDANRLKERGFLK